MSAAEARRCLETLDVHGMRRVASAIMPHIAAGSDEAVLQAMHIARTATESLPLKLRAYSHRWLADRALPSQLPDRLKPSAERLYPRVVSAVGISVNLPRDLRPAADMIRTAMSDEVEDCYASKREEPEYVKPRMDEAGRKERKALFGHLTKLYQARTV